MNSFIRGLGGGIGRAIGRILGLIIVAILGFLLITYLDIDIKSVIRNTLFLNARAMEQTTDITNQIHTDTTVCSMSGGNGTYCVDGGYSRNVKTTYNGRAQCIGFAFDYYFMSNRDYTLNIIANSNDFRNNSLTYYGYSYTTYPGNAFSVPIQGRFINKQKIQIVFPYDAQETHAISICSNSYMTGDTNYNIKQVYLTYDDGQQDISGIVDNATQNTTDIINNNNSNTETINENIFTNVQSIIKEIANRCNNLIDLDWLQRGVLNNNDGSVVDNGGSIDNINKENGSFTFTNNGSWTGFTYNRYLDVSDYDLYLNYNSSALGNTLIKVVGYDSSYNRVSNKEYWRVSNVPLCTSSITGICNGTNVKYVRFSIETYETSSFNISYLRVNNNNNQYCQFGTTTSKLDDIGGVLGGIGDNINTTNDKIDNMNDTIKDDSIDTTQSNAFFNNFQDNTHGLSGIITIPLSTIQSLATKQCSPILLPIPYTNKNITLPCLTPIYEQHVPVLLSLIRTLWYGILSYYVLTDIFFMVKGFKDPDSDKIEVLDL